MRFAEILPTARKPGAIAVWKFSRRVEDCRLHVFCGIQLTLMSSPSFETK